MVAQLKLHGGRQRRFNLWIPLFLVWLVLLPLAVLLAPFVLVACLVAGINFFRLIGAGWGLLSSLRETDLEIDSPGAGIFVRVR